MEETYLDNAGTTRPRKEVVDTMLQYLTKTWQNPSSLYSSGAKVNNAIESARSVVGRFIGAKPNEVYFTSGSSESNCTALLGFMLHQYSTWGDAYIITTRIEHKSILSCVRSMDDALICSASYLDVDSDGFVDADKIASLIESSGRNPQDILVSVMYANNEIGTVQDIKRISDVVHEHGCLLHVDATQAFGQIPINVNDLGIDMLSASAHKIGGAKGTGILYKREGVDISPIIFGSQMDGMRGGTENVAGIVGMARAVELAEEDMPKKEWLARRRDYLIDGLERIGCKLNGPRTMRLPNNVNVQLPVGVSGESMLYCLDMGGIEISTGSACNSHSVEPSHVLKAIGLTDEEAARTIRITISDEIDYDTIDMVVDEIDKNIKLIKSE